jgi:predicted N-acyltransferase
MTTAPVAATTGPSVRLWESIHQVDVEAWERLRRDDAGPFMDRRLLAAVERSFAPPLGRFWYAVVEDADGRPVATAVFCCLRVDATVLAEGGMKAFAKRIAPWIPGGLHFPVLFCGIPISAGQSSLRFAPEADVPAVLRLLDETATKLARQSRSKCVVWKEFTDAERERTDGLLQMGYQRADSLPMNSATTGHRSFDAFHNSLKSNKRKPIRTSRRKFAASNLRIEQRRGGDGVPGLYTDDVHRLYLNVLDRAAVRLETIPRAFFQELARELPNETSFTLAYDGDRIVGFACSVFTPHVFHQMFVGVDYDLNPQCDLYFNLFFHALDAAYRESCMEILVGQSADTFKQRKLLCTPIPLSFYIKGVDFATAWVLKTFRRSLFPPRGTALDVVVDVDDEPGGGSNASSNRASNRASNSGSNGSSNRASNGGSTGNQDAKVP